MRRASVAALVVVVLSLAASLAWKISHGPANLAEARQTVAPRLQTEMAAGGLAFGQAIFVRVFKESRELELWTLSGNAFRLFKTYPICTYSGDLGPKLAEGDHQSPEGFYSVTPSQMNPNSRYHLSYNIGFPNEYDRAHGRTGSYLMIHGNRLSAGCYAMTNAGIEEIYLLAEAVFKSGQERFPVHIFPFRMTEENKARQTGSPWREYWDNLKQGYDLFENTKVPPEVSVKDRRYVFDLGAAGTSQ
jgi:murein L,D-transpeptidase YafK